MPCVKCNKEVQYGLRYCTPCIQTEKNEKKEAERQYYIKQKDYKEKIESFKNKKEVEKDEHPNTNAITCTATILQQLKHEYRKNKVKTDEEYKAMIQEWIDSECKRLDERLKKAAMNGEDSYRICSELIVNPGTLSGKRCYIDWEFEKYLTSLIDPLIIFKEKVGTGITVKCKTCDGIYSGQEKYPDSPEDIILEYEFSW